MVESPSVDVVSVFTDESGAFGNPLGILFSTGQTRGREQQIASALGYSETVFIDEIVEHGGGTGSEVDAGTTGAGSVAGSPRRTAVIRIFTPARELPFAGHPSVGTAWWLNRRGTPVSALRVPAGEVAVRYDGDLTRITGRASWAPEFVWHELVAPAEVEALEAPTGPEGPFGSGHHYAWAWVDEPSGHLRSRMFAPDLGVNEDEATGAAAVRITALLGRDLAIDQGVGSRILTRHLGGETVEVGGRTTALPGVPLPA